MTDKTGTTETLQQFAITGVGCLAWMGIPAALLGIIALIKIVF